MIQVRFNNGSLAVYETLADAFRAAEEDEEIWKISFDGKSGERVRLIRTEGGWLYEDIYGNRHDKKGE